MSTSNQNTKHREPLHVSPRPTSRASGENFPLAARATGSRPFPGAQGQRGLWRPQWAAGLEPTAVFMENCLDGNRVLREKRRSGGGRRAALLRRGSVCDRVTADERARQSFRPLASPTVPRGALTVFLPQCKPFGPRCCYCVCVCAHACVFQEHVRVCTCAHTRVRGARERLLGHEKRRFEMMSRWPGWGG